MLAKALAPHASAIPALSHEIEALKRRSLEADRWLPTDRSADLAMYSRDAVAKLAFWLAAAPAFGEDARAVLQRLVLWFIRYIDERSDALCALARGEPTDVVLERVLEMQESFAKVGDPVSCANRLIESGEAEESDFAPASKPEPEPASEFEPEAKAAEAEAEPATESPWLEREGPTSVLAGPTDLGGSAAALVSLIAPIGAEDWKAVRETILSVRRLISTDEDRRRLDEVEEFGGTVAALQGGGDAVVDTATLVAAARVLSGSGGLVQRALPTKRLLEIAVLVLAAAIRVDHVQAPEPATSTDPDGSWAALLRKGELLRQLSGPGAPARTARVLENLCVGSLGGDVVERVWHAVTNAPGRYVARRGCWCSSTHRSLDHHIVQLAERYLMWGSRRCLRSAL